MKLIKYVLFGCLMQFNTGLSAQSMILETLEKEQAYIKMAVSVQEQIIQCFDVKLHSTFEYSFRINNGKLRTTLRSDSVSGFDININIHTDEVAPHLISNSWTVMFGKLNVSFREWYLNENLELKTKIMAIFEQEKERYENDYYLNILPKKPAIIYNNLGYAQLVESIFNELIAMDMGRYGVNIGPTSIYLDTYKDRFVMHARWIDNRARGYSENYEMGNLKIVFQDYPENANKTFDERLNIIISTSGDSANEIKEEIEQIINSKKQAFLEKDTK